RAELAQVTGPAGETRHAMLRRLSISPGDPTAAESRGTLMLLRFPNLAPGSARLRALDSVDVEHFLHAMMESAVRPGNHIGRPSFHEIVLRNPQQASEGAVHSLLTALFAQALRCERFGIEPRDAALRIAYGRLDDASPGVDVALDRLVKALDAPAQAGLRKMEIRL
ncbi:MAG: hypothetical protein HGA21_14885, partial [Burkholderiaceae bacterium]|nr:hypothetical protein [Burkholderiaceae bacterium]